MEINHIYNEHYRDTIKKIKRNGIQIDAVITDPPYNVSRKNNFQTINRHGIDFGEWDKNFNQKQWIRSVAPIVKNGGSIIIFNDWRNLGIIADTLEKNGFSVKDILRWEKTNPMPRNRERRYITDYEFAIWGVKNGDKWTFNRPKNQKYMRPKFEYSVNQNNRIHPTQKSVKMMQEIIRIHTNKNDLIYDPFSGSGSISLACFLEHRNYIASEIDLEYYEKSIKRMEKYEKE